MKKFGFAGGASCAAANKKQKYKKSDRWTALNIILLIILVLYTVSMIILYLWGIFTSLKSRWEFDENKVFMPSGLIWNWKWSNYAYVWQNFAVISRNTAGQKVITDIYGQILNTVLYAGVGAILQAIVPCVIAYITYNYKFFFSKVIYTVVIVTMVIPVIGNTPAMILFLKNLNFYDTFMGTYIMKFNFMGMYYLVFYAVFQGLSKEYYEAANIDGASELRIMTSIMLPLVKSTIYTVFLIKFIEFWNDYQVALMYMPSKPTLAYGVYYLSVSNEEGLSSAPMRLTCCMITATPILILFIALRNKIMGNLTMGGVKE